jgi:sugar phosphate isomerase/epimerase
MLRRTFLKTAPAAAALAAGTAAPEGIRLGFDSYSVRAFKWKDIQLIEYAAGLKLDTIQISSLNDFESLEPAHLRKVKDTADRLGIVIDGGIGCVCPSSASYNRKEGEPAAYIERGLRVAKAVGATSMRCYMGANADRHGKLPIEAHMENTIKVFRSVRAQALDLGVKIALENHSGDMQAREVRTIIEESGKDFVASCMDTGNPMWVVEDPFVTLETLAPYVVTTHVRDSAVFEVPRGAAAQWVALGDGCIDFKRFVALYRKLCPQASMQLEIITGRKPTILPYLEPDFWKAYAKMPAAEFARFVALAKNGHPFMGDMVVADTGGKQPPAIEEALKQQQRADLERSLEYAKKMLDVGVRWRAA